MAWKRVVTEMGMGTDIRGGDYTKAAVRALRDALWHNSLSVTRALRMDVDSMRVEVIIGVSIKPLSRMPPPWCVSTYPRRIAAPWIARKRCNIGGCE